VIDLNTFRNRALELERVQIQNAVTGQASDNAQVAGLAEFWHLTRLTCMDGVFGTHTAFTVARALAGLPTSCPC
jgi:hypothetical protein